VIKEVVEFPGGMYSSSFGFFMNEGKWNKLAKEDQAAIDRLSREHVARTAGKSWDGADAKSREAMKKAGVPLVKAPSPLVAEVRKRSDPLVEDWIAKANAKGVDAPKVLAEFRAELKKVAAGK
jgi:TRAP-type C4-dicarboxylate transport system substrate-binding protein